MTPDATVTFDFYPEPTLPTEPRFVVLLTCRETGEAWLYDRKAGEGRWITKSEHMALTSAEDALDDKTWEAQANGLS